MKNTFRCSFCNKMSGANGLNWHNWDSTFQDHCAICSICMNFIMEQETKHMSNVSISRGILLAEEQSAKTEMFSHLQKIKKSKPKD